MSRQALMVVPSGHARSQHYGLGKRLLGASAVVTVVGCVCVAMVWNSQQITHHPPWVYGSDHARFTIIEYSDLECPYCRLYFPQLRNWIDHNSDINWEWRNLPLPDHEPEATRAARIVECTGEVSGNAAFWGAVAWLYEHPDPQTWRLESMTDTHDRKDISKCLASQRPDVIIRQQALEAKGENIAATPSLRLLDRVNNRSVNLEGVIDPDVLSSIVDALATASDASSASRE